MNATSQSERDQAALWNGSGGRGWVEAQEVLDRLLEPFEGMLVESIRSGDQVLDVGCGTGAVAVAAARRSAPAACTAIDISGPMIQAARVRAERDTAAVTLVCADAQTYGFQPASFDKIVSRFGVMFFRDSVPAFENLRRASRVGAELRFTAWRAAEENPIMTAAERAAAPLLPELPSRRNDEPGQFAFADAQRVRAILERSGWRSVEIQRLDVTCAFPEADLVRYLTLVGPLGRHLQKVDEATRAEVLKLVRPAFDRFVEGKDVRFEAACWMVTARN